MKNNFFDDIDDNEIYDNSSAIDDMSQNNVSDFSYTMQFNVKSSDIENIQSYVELALNDISDFVYHVGCICGGKSTTVTMEMVSRPTNYRLLSKVFSKLNRIMSSNLFIYTIKDNRHIETSVFDSNGVLAYELYNFMISSSYTELYARHLALYTTYKAAVDKIDVINVLKTNTNASNIITQVHKQKTKIDYNKLKELYHNGEIEVSLMSIRMFGEVKYQMMYRKSLATNDSFGRIYKTFECVVKEYFKKSFDNFIVKEFYKIKVVYPESVKHMMLMHIDDECNNKFMIPEFQRYVVFEQEEKDDTINYIDKLTNEILQMNK